ncbi:MAG: alanine/ornithine racemase family PLP-dependent enzyme [Clostridia bacterium]|nr:alanine/ornithine racemase family PLP-dependent enzyme [Clostridia bacterium]
MYPVLKTDLKKIKENVSIIAKRCGEKNIDIMCVTKVFCADPKVAQAVLDGGATMLADSRVKNLMKLKDLNAKKVLIRIPMLSEVEEVVKYADLSFNSELKTIKAIDAEAKKAGKVHDILLMVDLGDLREGVLPKDVDATVEEILKLDNINLYGLGVNLTCYGGIIPSTTNLGELVEIATAIEKKFNIKLQMVSGGNSSSYYLVENGQIPTGITNLRPGEAYVLGRETAYGHPIEGLHSDCFTLEGQIVELKEKDSLPKGEIGMDAFGNVPSFEDKGKMLRAIVAVGQQDARPGDLVPRDEKTDILGASSDHLIVDITHSDKEYQVGDILSFSVDYGSLLMLATSEYVTKVSE